MRLLFCMALDEVDNAQFVKLLNGAATVVSALQAMPSPTLIGDRIKRFENARALVERTLRVTAPAEHNLPAFLAMPPQTVTDWSIRSAVLMVATNSLCYVVDQVAVRNLDLTVHLTLARALGVPVIGLLNRELRGPLESAQLTLTDVVIGEVEPSTLARLIRSLTEEDSGR